MEYSKINLQQGNIEIFGIWNIPGIFQKNLQQGNIEIFWKWNIPGIFKKKPSTKEILKFLEYGI